MSVVLVIGQVDGAPIADGAASATVGSVWDFMIKGGPVMIPIVALSLIALAIVVERLFVLRRPLIIPPGFVDGLKAIVAGGPGARREAVDYCRASPSPISSICEEAVKRLGSPIEEIERKIQEAGAREVFRLRRRLRALAVIASVAPLLGLLGTIFGMIQAFQTVATSGEALGRTELLAGGIYEAMITTAAGLLVAIPSLIFYHAIAARIDRLVAEMDRVGLELVEACLDAPRAEARPLASRALDHDMPRQLDGSLAAAAT